MKYFLLLISLGLCANLKAQVSITSTSTIYTQDFNTLNSNASGNNSGSNWTQNSTLVGWYAYDNAVTSTTKTAASNGGNSTAAFYSLGSTAASSPTPDTERALGALPGSTSTRYIALQLTNNSGSSINSINLSYNLEQWKSVVLSNQVTMTLDYQLVPSSSFTGITNTTETWNKILGANATLPSVVSSGPAAIDGDLPANQVSITNINTNLVTPWTQGSELWLRWTLPASNGIYGIDDFSLSVASVPEPLTLFLSPLLLAVLFLFKIRRQNNRF